MNQEYTHILIVLDASGSMCSIENSVKENFNAFLAKQREAGGKTRFDLFQFANHATRLVTAADLALYREDLMAKYHCSGSTALNDAVCIAIDTLGEELAAMTEAERPAHVLCAIITDGEENSSREFTAEDVKNRITHQRDVYSWEFVFLAANQDAFLTGSRLGLRRETCIHFDATPGGMKSVKKIMCSLTAGIRNRK